VSGPMYASRVPKCLIICMKDDMTWSEVQKSNNQVDLGFVCEKMKSIIALISRIPILFVSDSDYPALTMHKITCIKQSSSSISRGCQVEVVNVV